MALSTASVKILKDENARLKNEKNYYAKLAGEISSKIDELKTQKDSAQDAIAKLNNKITDLENDLTSEGIVI